MKRTRRTALGLGAAALATFFVAENQAEGTRAACDATDDANKEVVRRWLAEVWSAGNVDVLDEIAAEDYAPNEPGAVPGRDAWKQRTRDAIERFASIIPNVHYVADDLFAADGRVCLRARIAGTSIAGKAVDAPFINVFLFRDGLIASWWGSDVSADLARAF